MDFGHEQRDQCVQFLSMVVEVSLSISVQANDVNERQTPFPAQLACGTSCRCDTERIRAMPMDEKKGKQQQ